MIKYDTDDFTKQLIGFSNFLQEIKNDNIEDYFNFTRDEYEIASIIYIKTQIAKCYTLWKMFHKFELKLAEDPLKKLKKADFTNWYNEQKALVEELSGTDEVNALVVSCFDVSSRRAGDRIKVGLIIEKFIKEELAEKVKNEEHEIINLVSPGLKVKHLMALIGLDNPTKELREMLLNCDSAGFKTVEDEKKTIKPKWYERDKVVRSICDKMEFMIMHDIVFAQQGPNILTIPKGTKFYANKITSDTKEIHNETKAISNRKQSFGDQLSGT